MSTEVTVDYASNRSAQKAAGLVKTTDGYEGYTSAKITSLTTVVKAHRYRCSVRLDLPADFGGSAECPLPAYRVHNSWQLGEWLNVFVNIYRNRFGQIEVQFKHVESDLDPAGENTNVTWYPVTAC